MQRRLKPHTWARTPHAAILCDGGCNPAWLTLQPHVAEAATLCGGGCDLACGEGCAALLRPRCYIVEHGKFVVKVTKDDGSTHDVSAIGPGGCFGEMSLLYSAKRTASVAAQGHSSVWAMHREVTRAEPHSMCMCTNDMNTVHTSVPADPLTLFTLLTSLTPPRPPSTPLIRTLTSLSPPSTPLNPSQVYQQILEEASREQLRQRRGFLRRMKLFHGLDKVHLTTVAQCCSDIRFGGERGGSGVFTQDPHPGQGHNQGQGQDQTATKEVPISVSSNDLLCKSATLQALPIISPLDPLTCPYASRTSPYTPCAAGTARH